MTDLNQTKPALLILTASLAALLMACEGDTPAPAATEAPVKAAEAPKPAPEPAKPAFDAKTSFANTCASCHGTEGKGDGPAAAALKPKPAAFGDAAFWEGRTKEQLIKVIKEGGPAVGKSPLMAPFGATFSDEQIDALAEYIMTFKPAG